MKPRASIKQYVIAVVIGLGLVVGVASVEATGTWSQPCGTPPTCNADAPVNVGANTQSKAGQLFVNTGTPAPYAVGLQVFGQSIFDNSSAGTSAIQIKDGSQGIGKVLTSDASGNGTWMAAGAGSGSSGTSVVSMGDVSISSSAPTSWTTVNVGPSGLNLVPPGATAVFLRSKTFIEPPADESGTVSLLARQSSSQNTTTSVSVNQVNEGAYIVGVGNSGSALVPLTSNDTFDYEMSVVNNSGGNATASLYIDGYVAPAWPALNVSPVACHYSSTIEYPNTPSQDTKWSFTFSGSPTGGKTPYAGSLGVQYQYSADTNSSTNVPGTYIVKTYSDAVTSASLSVTSADGQTGNVACVTP